MYADSLLNISFMLQCKLNTYLMERNIIKLLFLFRSQISLHQYAVW